MNASYRPARKRRHPKTIILVKEQEERLMSLMEGTRSFIVVAKYIYAAAKWISAVGGATVVIGYLFRLNAGG